MRGPTYTSIVRWGLIIILVAGVIAYLRFVPEGSSYSPRNIIGYILPKPKVVERIVVVDVPGPTVIRTIPKDRIIEYYNDLPTPQTVMDNASIVVAVAEIPPCPSGGTAISVLRETDNVAIGHIEFKPKKERFFDIRKEFGGRAGLGTGGLVLGEVYARPVRIGPVVLEARGYAKRDDRSGADFGGVVLLDWRF